MYLVQKQVYEEGGTGRGTHERKTLTSDGFVFSAIFLRVRATKYYLAIHQRRVHFGVKNITCDVCHKSFFDQATLKVHYRSHTGEKPYSCDVCKKSFSHSCHLNRHKKLHTGEKPHACDVCQKAFLQKSNMDQHRKIHFKHVKINKEK